MSSKSLKPVFAAPLQRSGLKQQQQLKRDWVKMRPQERHTSAGTHVEHTNTPSFYISRQAAFTSFGVTSDHKADGKVGTQGWSQKSMPCTSKLTTAQQRNFKRQD